MGEQQSKLKVSASNLSLTKHQQEVWCSTCRNCMTSTEVDNQTVMKRREPLESKDDSLYLTQLLHQQS